MSIFTPQELVDAFEPSDCDPQVEDASAHLGVRVGKWTVAVDTKLDARGQESLAPAEPRPSSQSEPSTRGGQPGSRNEPSTRQPTTGHQPSGGQPSQRQPTHGQNPSNLQPTHGQNPSNRQPTHEKPPSSSRPGQTQPGSSNRPTYSSNDQEMRDCNDPEMSSSMPSYNNNASYGSTYSDPTPLRKSVRVAVAYPNTTPSANGNGKDNGNGNGNRDGFGDGNDNDEGFDDGDDDGDDYDDDEADDDENDNDDEEWMIGFARKQGTPIGNRKPRNSSSCFIRLLLWLIFIKLMIILLIWLLVHCCKHGQHGLGNSDPMMPNPAMPNPGMPDPSMPGPEMPQPQGMPQPNPRIGRRPWSMFGNVLTQLAAVSLPAGISAAQYIGAGFVMSSLGAVAAASGLLFAVHIAIFNPFFWLRGVGSPGTAQKSRRSRSTITSSAVALFGGAGLRTGLNPLQRLYLAPLMIGWQLLFFLAMLIILLGFLILLAA